MNDEDLNTYLSTMSLDDTQLTQLKQGPTSLFETYDTSAAIESLRILSTDSADAQVEVIQLTKIISGPDFMNNRITALHHLRKINGQWKIFRTDKIGEVEYLDKKVLFKRMPLHQT